MASRDPLATSIDADDPMTSLEGHVSHVHQQRLKEKRGNHRFN